MLFYPKQGPFDTMVTDGTTLCSSMKESGKEFCHHRAQGVFKERETAPEVTPTVTLHLSQAATLM